MLTITTCEQLGGDATYDTDIVVYEGNTCGALVRLACNDDDPNNPCGQMAPWHSTVNVPLLRNQTVLIRLGGWRDAGDRGTGHLLVELTPDVLDSDFDGVEDCDEILMHGTDPFDADTDDDLLDDGAEIALAGFGGCPDPLVADSDGDGILDGLEVALLLDPCDADTDADGLADGLEGAFGTNPFDQDSDDDGLFDGTEVDIALGSGCPDPTSADSDADGLTDGDEVLLHSTQVCNPDTDGDGLLDGEDPTPDEPGAPDDYIEEVLDELANEILDPAFIINIDAPNDNAAAGRQSALSDKLQEAQALVDAGDIAGAIGKLENVLMFIDGEPGPADWLEDGPDKDMLREEVELMISLLELAL